MVNFGKRLKANQVEEWKGYYINYKLIKTKVKQYVQEAQTGTHNGQQVLIEISRILDDQIEKIVLFLLEQQGVLASRLEQLGEQRTLVVEHSCLIPIPELREAYQAVGEDLLKLLHFVDMNATAIRKILKKVDKRFGYKFTDYYVFTRANHPYSQLQQVIKQVGIGAVAGTLSRNLTFLLNEECHQSIYDEPSIVVKDPVIMQINDSIDKLTHSTDFLHFLGQRALILPSDIESASENVVGDDNYHFISLLLNLVNTFLYMVNTYVVVPTADDYSVSLGAAPTVCGIVIGSMAVAQLFSSVYFSAWSNRSYFRPLVFSSIMLFFGNVLYALAYDMRSLLLLLIGRLLCGLGSARAVNRRYISDCVPLKFRLQASAGFVSASALGMACGPALAGVLQTKFRVYHLTFDQKTLPGWVMSVAWLAYLLWLWFAFKEPERSKEESSSNRAANASMICSNVAVRSSDPEINLGHPLLMVEDHGDDDDDAEESQESSNPATSISSAYKLLTPSVKVQLLIYFMLKYAIEILLSESSVITNFYFSWSTSSVAVFLAVLGLTVLPVNAIVGSYISNLFEDRQILLAAESMVLVGTLCSFRFGRSYSVPQYVLSALVTFVSAEVLEGVNLSLLSRIMSSRLAQGTYNGGLLSTEAGTLARVVADGTITLAGYLGSDHLLNVTLLPSLLICTVSIATTCCTYNTLY